MKLRLRNLDTVAPIVTCVVLFLFFSLITDSFLTRENLLNILRQNSALAVMAVGVTFVLLTGEIDVDSYRVVGKSRRPQHLRVKLDGPLKLLGEYGTGKGHRLAPGSALPARADRIEGVRQLLPAAPLRTLIKGFLHKSRQPQALNRLARGPGQHANLK